MRRSQVAALKFRRSRFDIVAVAVLGCKAIFETSNGNIGYGNKTVEGNAKVV